MVDFLKDLNEAQQLAVKEYEGPSLVIAGAGSGKTRVLTYRIAYLLHLGVSPGQILALTFTNKAAREMKERIGQLVGESLARDLWMGTFHSVFARILRFDGNLLGYPSGYTIYDTTDSKNVVKAVVRDMKLDEQVYKPGEVFGRISRAKNNLITPTAYLGSHQLIEQDKRSRKPRLVEIYEKYVRQCRKSDAMDFDDLLLNTFILFRDHPEVLKKYQGLFSYLLVDEYQDTNFVQYRIINQLSELNKNICVVGDDAQSIYSFRGARIENILNFRHDYPDYSLFKLEQNYRSTKNIIDAANSLIKKNQGQISKEVWSDNETGEKIRLLRSRTDNDEGFAIASLIKDTAYRDHLKYNDFTILYRTNAQSRIFEESLRKLNIPYVVYGSLSFYQRKEIKDLLAYYRLVVNPCDEEALTRIINYPARGIGNTSINRLLEIAGETGKRPWDILNSIDEYGRHYNKGTIRKLKDFTGMINDFISQTDIMEAFDLAFVIAEKTGILQEYHYDRSPENISKHENIQELLNSIKEYTDSQTDGQTSNLSAYLQNIALLTDADNDKYNDRDRVSVMTMHSAKGLEFKHVFVAGLEEDLFPSRLSSSTREELEEERRLFYVAITRAMKKLTLSYAERRYKWGVLINCIPSRFFKEIDQEYFEEAPFASLQSQDITSGSGNGGYAFRSHARSLSGTSRRKKDQETINTEAFVPGNFTRISTSRTAPEEPQDFTPDKPESIRAGMEVAHQRFGKGKVLKLDGELQNRKATVFFAGVGQKQLLLRFAKLKILASHEGE